jgi:superfamily II DNA/RNA helicase
VIIFTHTKRNTKTLHQMLVGEWLNCGLLNWDMAQGKRQAMLNDFKLGKTQVLVTTDVAARWLNMENVWLVINFDVPADPKSYIHRIGRTGRAGALGKAIMLVSPLEKILVQDIERMHKIRIQQSEHKPLDDRQWVYGNLRLDRSTDKKWWGKNQRPKHLSPTQKYGKLPPFDDQKHFKTENNYRSNPHHKQHERRPGRPDDRRPSTGGYQWSRPDNRFPKPTPGGYKKPDDRRPISNWYQGKRPDDRRPSSGGYQWNRPDNRPSKPAPFRGMGKPRHR